MKTAEGRAQSKTVNATADANVLTTVGNAEAGKTKAISTAEADVIKLNRLDGVRNYAGIEISQGPVRERLQARAGRDGCRRRREGGSSLVSVLLANLIRDGLKRPETAP